MADNYEQGVQKITTEVNNLERQYRKDNTIFEKLVHDYKFHADSNKELTKEINLAQYNDRKIDPGLLFKKYVYRDLISELNTPSDALNLLSEEDKIMREQAKAKVKGLDEKVTTGLQTLENLEKAEFKSNQEALGKVEGSMMRIVKNVPAFNNSVKNKFEFDKFDNAVEETNTKDIRDALNSKGINLDIERTGHKNKLKILGTNLEKLHTGMINNYEDNKKSLRPLARKRQEDIINYTKLAHDIVKDISDNQPAQVVNEKLEQMEEFENKFFKKTISSAKLKTYDNLDNIKEKKQQDLKKEKGFKKSVKIRFKANRDVAKERAEGSVRVGKAIKNKTIKQAKTTGSNLKKKLKEKATSAVSTVGSGFDKIKDTFKGRS